MKTISKTVYEDPSRLFRHVGYIYEITEELSKIADHRGLLEFDGYARQSISGKFGLTKNDLESIMKLCEIYGFVKLDRRSKMLRLVRH